MYTSERFYLCKQIMSMSLYIIESHTIIPSFDLRYDGSGSGSYGSGGEAILHAMRRLLGFKLLEFRGLGLRASFKGVTR